MREKAVRVDHSIDFEQSLRTLDEFSEAGAKTSQRWIEKLGASSRKTVGYAILTTRDIREHDFLERRQRKV